MNRDRASEQLEALLARAHEQLGIAVYDGLMSSGGPPELRDPDQTLGRLLAAVHRQTGDAVVGRLVRRGRRAPRERAVADRVGTSEGLLMRRPAFVRLKYREQALHCARRYWPVDVVRVIRDAVDTVQQLIADLEEEILPDTARDQLLRVSSGMGHVLALPQPPQVPQPALGGFDYMEEVEDVLVTCMWRLVAEARRSKQLLDNELLLHFRWTDMSWLGALEVSQDLADDLDLAYREALALSTAVTAVEEASTDFRGADLQSVDLDGVDLEGIRWDTATSWPPEWKERIWRASLAAGTGHGELIVGAEPRDSTIPVDI
ncbi:MULTISPECIES: hypothetical protein [Streptomyces]|uniref:hypothetical protein n=1 Tax=Streptomyces TaxID=1883 RepID=UPI000E0217EC|nr:MULTISPECIES: hypothetical protein [Streptomyces]MBT3075172.1 hypothetical protein [Streptomyces sp. COG21]MBT3078356.1 hypothetical protein [Streptomyces sp. COG21]MBT3091280.1 hypothetical protein [Streptomyces sp. CYG21]MBT3097698.1 hypothetical protein [Streptomyces sp. CBG30]MBT3104000.1 hypothetical protein [Streptomyces sp. COG19]